MNLTEEQKQELLTTNQSFCMLPWISMHVTPTGVATPCCIGNQVYPVGNANQMNLMELVNSDAMKELRNDMLQGTKNSICSACHRHEDQGIYSFRKNINNLFGKYLDEVLSATDYTGELGQFKMRYFDLRLNNICNMKCRTCNSHYSSQWENEDAKQGRSLITISKDNRTKYVDDILNHIQHIDTAYFAGGEPLITEEHYVMLEEMIRLNRTDIRLRYNTNLSNLKYKNKDLLDLWSRFDNKIDVYASIDDFGKRAEYIRSGTVWEEIEENFKRVKSVPYVVMQINSVLSIFNFTTFGEFYHYLLDNELYLPTDEANYIYNMISPQHIAAIALPTHLKIQGIEGLESVLARMNSMGFRNDHTQPLIDAKKWVLSADTWEQHKPAFQEETSRLDKIREEKFIDVFPELAELME